MSRLPQLEAQLVAAAGRRRPRARRPRLIAAAALAAAACVAVALLLVPSSKPDEQPARVPETVPAQTLVKARKLANLPRPPEVRVRDDQIAAVARQEVARMPYPPGMRDEFDYFKHRRSMFNSSAAVRASVEYHAYCSWVRYWVAGADRAGATAVLEQVPYWPLIRRADNDRAPAWQKKIAAAARKGDGARMRYEATTNCRAAR